jgi:hypothetical protein
MGSKELGRVMMKLKCILTEKEILEAGAHVARAVERRRGLVAEKAQVVRELSTNISSQEGLIEKNAEKVRSGYEFRDVECVRRMGDDGQVYTLRTDTFETLSVEPATAYEKQLSLELITEAE